MCGIAGRANLSTGAPADEDIVRRMCDLIAHRGPDGQGTWSAGPAALGHRRLAIIDLSPGGHQPMVSHDGRYCITFNGEIYNFLELRRELAGKGYAFRSQSDTEVLLAAYAEYGTSCLPRLRGMFAFAVWDVRDRVLFAARDRLGKKPLFYRLHKDGLSFASEPKAFLAEPDFVVRPNLQAIGHYLSLQSVPAPLSAFEGVSKLPPAHYLVYRGGEPEVRRYWKLSYRTKFQGSEDDAAERLTGLLRDAVRLRLVSDVPLGAFLSGGIDSGTIVALMSELGTGPVKTFSIGFEEEGFDELTYARLVAQRYGTDHHEFVVKADAAAVLPKLVWHYGEPFADPSALPTYYLSELTRRHVTVALNGDAGDENFAGYGRYLMAPRDLAWWRLPAPARRVAASAAELLAGRANSLSVPGRASRWLRVRAGTMEEYQARRLMQFDSEEKLELCTPEFLAETPVSTSTLVAEWYAESDGDDLLDRTLDVDVRGYLPDALLVKVDIATMAVGLEGRSPLLDHTIAEFAASLPPDLKVRNGVKKYLLKKVSGVLLPPEIVGRPKKGFSVPVGEWFRGGLREMLYDTLLSGSALRRGLFRPEAVTRIAKDHIEGKQDNREQLWNLLMLELWWRRFVDEAPALACGASSQPESTPGKG